VKLYILQAAVSGNASAGTTVQTPGTATMSCPMPFFVTTQPMNPNAYTPRVKKDKTPNYLARF